MVHTAPRGQGRTPVGSKTALIRLGTGVLRADGSLIGLDTGLMRSDRAPIGLDTGLLRADGAPIGLDTGLIRSDGAPIGLHEHPRPVIVMSTAPYGRFRHTQ